MVPLKKVFINKQSENLVGTDWMERFKLWGQSINNFCHQRENSTTEAQEFKVELKENALLACKKKIPPKIEWSNGEVR